MAELAELIERNRRDDAEMFPSPETQAQQRGYLAQVPVGLARGLGGALASVPRALSAIPGVRAFTEPIAEGIDAALPLSSGGYLEGGVESASKSLAVGGMAYAALAGTGGLAAPGVAGFLGSNALRIGAVTGLTFGAGELAESRKRLEGLNTAAVSAGLAPLTDGEIYEIAGTRGLIEGGFETLGGWFIGKRLLSGAVAEGFKGSLAKLLPGAAGQVVRESATIAAEEVPVEMLQAGVQSAIERGVLGEQRTKALEQAGEPVAPPIMTAAGQVATPAGIASAIFGGVRVATSRPMPASGSAITAAGTPTPTATPVPVAATPGSKKVPLPFAPATRATKATDVVDPLTGAGVPSSIVPQAGGAAPVVDPLTGAPATTITSPAEQEGQALLAQLQANPADGAVKAAAEEWRLANAGAATGPIADIMRAMAQVGTVHPTATPSTTTTSSAAPAGSSAPALSPPVSVSSRPSTPGRTDYLAQGMLERLNKPETFPGDHRQALGFLRRLALDPLPGEELTATLQQQALDAQNQPPASPNVAPVADGSPPPSPVAQIPPAPSASTQPVPDGLPVVSPASLSVEPVLPPGTPQNLPTEVPQDVPSSVPEPPIVEPAFPSPSAGGTTALWKQTREKAVGPAPIIPDSPRPLKKTYGIDGPTPNQAKDHRAQVNARTRGLRQYRAYIERSNAHLKAIRGAMEAGESVSPEVLADYPLLAPEVQGRTPPSAATGATQETEQPIATVDTPTAALTGTLERPTGQLQGGLGEDAGVPSGAATSTTATPDEPSLFGAVPSADATGATPGDSGTVAPDISPAAPPQDAAVPTQGIAEPELGMEAPTEAQDTPWTPYGEAGYAYREVGLGKWEVRTGEGEVLPLRPSSETGAKTRITRLVNEAKGIAALSKGGIPREAIPGVKRPRKIVPKKGQLQVLQGNTDAGQGQISIADVKRRLEQRTRKPVSSFENNDLLVLHMSDEHPVLVGMPERMGADAGLIEATYGPEVAAQVAQGGASVAGFFGDIPAEHSPTGKVLLNIQVSKQGTKILLAVDHELEHLAEHLGLFRPGDLDILDRTISRRGGMPNFLPGPEARAEYIAREVNKPRSVLMETAAGRIIARIQRFIDALAYAIGIRTSGQIVREFRSGAIFQREGSEGTAGAGQLELPAGPARLAPESKVTNPDGTLKVVGHATPESFDFFDPARKGTGAGQMFSGYFFAEDPAVHNRYADEFMAKGKEGVNTRPVYLDIKNPFYLNQEYGVDGRSGAEGQWDTEPLREAIDARFGLGAADFAVEQIERMEGTANVLNSDAYRLFKKYVEDADGKPIGAEGVSQVLEDMGYDGLYHEGKKDGKVWVAFHPDQIIPVLGNAQQRRGRLQVVTNPAQQNLPGIAATTTVSPAVAPVAPNAVPRANPGNVQTEAVPLDHYLFLNGIMTDDELTQGQSRAEQGLIPRNRKEVFHDPAMRSASEEKKQDWRDRPQDLQRRLKEVKDGKNAFTSPEFVALAMMAQEQHDLSKAMHAQGILTDSRFQEIRDAWSAPNGFLAYAQMAVSEGGRITRLGRYVGEWLGGAHTYAAAMRALDEKLNAIPPDQRDAFKDKLRAAFEANDYNTLQDLASQIPNSSLRERFFEFYYGSILSGFGTQAVNAFSTTASQLFHNSIIRPMAGMADAITAGITGRERRIFASEMLPALLTQFKGMSDVYKHAWWMWTGDTRKGQLLPFFRQETGVGGTEQGTASGAWARASYLEDHPAIGKTAGDPIVWMRKLAPLVTAASRLMAGLDVGMSLNAFDQEVSARARRESLRQKIPRDQQDAFEADYQQTFLSKHPPGVGDKLFEEVSQVMKQQVFHDGTGHLAQALGKLHSIPGIGAFFQLLTPFKSTPDALLRRGLELLPGTPLVNGWYRKNVSWKWGGWLPMVGKEAMNDEAMFMLARQATGILMTASLYAMWHAGRISGPPPEDPAEREAQQRAGIVPYSIKMGDSWYSWRRFEPMSLPLGIMVSAFDAKKRREERMEKRGDVPVGEVYDGLAITAVAVQAGIKYIMDASYFSGLANFLEGTTQGQQSGTGDIPRGLMRQIVSATTPWVGFQRSLINALDASGTVPGTTAGQVTIRQPQGLGETYAGSLFPFALMEGVGAKPRLSVFGQPLTRQSTTIGELTPATPPIQRGFNPPDALEDTLRRLRYFPGQPSKVDAVTGKAMSPELYRRLQVIRGPIVQAKLEQLVTHTNFDRLDPLDAKKKLQNAVSDATKQAKAQLARETR